MNLNKLYESIEDIKDVTDRCVAYSEVIIYLKGLKECINFQQQDTAWKELINKQLLHDIRRELDKKVDEVKSFIDFNVKH